MARVNLGLSGRSNGLCRVPGAPFPWISLRCCPFLVVKITPEPTPTRLAIFRNIKVCTMAACIPFNNTGTAQLAGPGLWWPYSVLLLACTVSGLAGNREALNLLAGTPYEPHIDSYWKAGRPCKERTTPGTKSPNSEIP